MMPARAPTGVRFAPKKNYHLGYLQFAKIGLTIMPLVIAVSCGVLAAELAIFPQ